MRVGAVTLAYNDEGIISGTIKCLNGYVNRHIVLISEKPYFGKVSSPDATEQIAVSLGADVVKGDWALDNYQRNCGLELCDDMDWVLGFDSDEMIESFELTRLFEHLENTKADAIAIRPEVYWKTTDYRLRPIPDYAPIIAMRPHVRFSYIRNIDHPFELYDGVTMHHVSWAAPKDIYKKVINYAHATDFNGEEWYKKHYETWEYGQKAILPTDEFDVIKMPLPEELRRYL